MDQNTIACSRVILLAMKIGVLEEIASVSKYSLCSVLILIMARHGHSSVIWL